MRRTLSSGNEHQYQSCKEHFLHRLLMTAPASKRRNLALARPD